MLLRPLLHIIQLTPDQQDMQQLLQTLQYQYHIYNSGTTLMGKTFHRLTHLLIHLCLLQT
jgi:hypothetical protein